MSVDLPEPFSPTTHNRSPRETVKFTSRSTVCPS